jgi:hypothetical protein
MKLSQCNNRFALSVQPTDLITVPDIFPKKGQAGPINAARLPIDISLYGVKQ